MKNKYQSIVFVVLLGIALVAGVYLVNQKQETRRGAYFATTKLFLLATTNEKKVGDDVNIELWADTTAKIDGARVLMCFDKGLSNADWDANFVSDPKQYVTINPATKFSDDIMVFKKDGGDTKDCYSVVFASNATNDQLTSGTVRLATIKFKPTQVGEGIIFIDKDQSMLSGRNDNSDTDKSVEVTEVAGATYKITAADGTVPTVTPTAGSSANDLKLNYKVSYDSVRPGFDKCADNWPVKIIVLSNGTSQAYTSTPVRTNEKVAVTKNGATTDLTVYSGSVTLTGFTKTDNVAVFIKGPKHLQVKYGKDGQSAYYNQAGGEISLANKEAVHDFSKFPLLAGDVVGANNETQDGAINAADFAYIKNHVLTNANFADGHYELADLDGNCTMKSRDTDIVRQSLNEKQGQLY